MSNEEFNDSFDTAKKLSWIIYQELKTAELVFVDTTEETTVFNLRNCYGSKLYNIKGFVLKTDTSTDFVVKISMEIHNEEDYRVSETIFNLFQRFPLGMIEAFEEAKNTKPIQFCNFDPYNFISVVFSDSDIRLDLMFTEKYPDFAVRNINEILKVLTINEFLTQKKSPPSEF